MKSIHTSVLLKESIEGLNLSEDNISSGKIVVDGTFGGGGHSSEILRMYPNVKIIALDQDSGAWDKAKDKFKDFEDRIVFINNNFRDIDKVLSKMNIKEIDGLILDLGLSSDQLENSGRGFTFMKDEPLLMTMKTNPRKDDLTAKDIVNTWNEESIANVIYGYGEERFSRRIAKAIREARDKKEIKTTFELVEIIRNAVPAKYAKGKIHFATRTFQALRIAVNDELNTLKMGLAQGFDILKKPVRSHEGVGEGGRMCVISFHSLEDRIVKNFYKEKVKKGEANLINKKVILASQEEVRNNPRSRSAKLRILSKN